LEGIVQPVPAWTNGRYTDNDEAHTGIMLIKLIIVLQYFDKMRSPRHGPMTGARGMAPGG